MRTKWTPPEKRTIFDPPLKLWYEKHKKYISVIAYIDGSNYPIITNDSWYKDSTILYIEEPPRRMTNRELMLLFSQGWWMLIHFFDNGNKSNIYSSSNGLSYDELDETVPSDIKISRIEETDWIEPTIDLLKGE